jgi:hypothetical protein
MRVNISRVWYWNDFRTVCSDEEMKSDIRRKIIRKIVNW